MQYANALAGKIRYEIQGPLHPENIENQIRQNLHHAQTQYRDLLSRLGDPDFAYAYNRLNSHPNVYEGWADHASVFMELVDAAMPLIRNHYID